MKFFQKTGVAVIFTVLMIAAALFIGLSPALKSEPVPEPMAQTTAQEQTASQTPAAEQTSNAAGDETISDKYIRDDAGLFTRSGENAIQDYNTKIYNKTGSHKFETKQKSQIPRKRAQQRSRRSCGKNSIGNGVSLNGQPPRP